MDLSIGFEFEGEGVILRAIGPKNVRVVENVGWWKNRMAENGYAGSTKYLDMVVGDELAVRSVDGGKWWVFEDSRLPWMVMYPDGSLCHYR